MLKPIPKTDITVRPFPTHKTWKFKVEDGEMVITQPISPDPDPNGPSIQPNAPAAIAGTEIIQF